MLTLRLLLVCLFAAVAASAQPASGEPSPVRLRFGPLLLTPTVALTNLGVDDNVFNQTDAERPQSDLTMTVTPHVGWQLRAGRARLLGSVNEDLVYYRRFASERSVNTTVNAALTLPLNRLTFAGDRSYVRARDRPGFEIDARSEHTEDAYGGSVDLRAFSKTFVGATVRRSTTAFDHDATFLGSSLWRELDRTTTSVGLRLRYRLTPLTSVVANVDRDADRFLVSTVRNSNSVAVTAGVRFEPTALVSGSATVGHRTFETLSADVPPFSGTILRVDLASVAIGSTRLGLAAARDVQYSYDFEQPYYLQTGLIGSVVQHLFGPVDLGGRFGVQRLAYRGRIGLTTPVSDRTDLIHTLGGTIDYRVARATRFGFNVDYQSRSSILAQRVYGGVRFGTSVAYGF